MHFQDFIYKRPDFEAFSEQFLQHLSAFEQATSFQEQDEQLAHINTLRSHFMSQYNICYIRYTMNTTDPFYEKENEYYDQQMPTYESLVNKFYKQLLHAHFRSDLEAKWGKQLFTIAEYSLKAFDDTIIELLQEENQLSSEYTKLKGSAKIQFQGEEHNLSSIGRFETDEDQRIRKAAAEAKWGFYKEHAKTVETIFDQLVKIRHRIAIALGYNNFVELGYVRMLRSDYNAEMVANFREQVRTHIVPITKRLYERQQKRLGLDELLYFDEDLHFLSGNPTPKGDPDWIIDQAQKMYEELSPETHQFFSFMKEKELMDLQTRPGKAPGGYCTYINDYKSPFIYSNFNGTSGDIDVLTHEAGHAFQVYSSRELGINEYTWPTYEACEIHSMSMEFFTWPWMNLFFREEVDKYKFGHLTRALYFLPYGVAVDEFQHYVYENPNASPQERNQAWRSIEKKYLPQRNYDGYEFLENGGYWQRQSHIFNMPFYYIDYALAQICAFQFWKKDQEQHDTAWSDYLRLCNEGGRQSFLNLVELAQLRSPFEDGCVASVVDIITAWLDYLEIESK
jgi:M3 family oligoendopeptidase